MNMNAEFDRWVKNIESFGWLVTERNEQTGRIKVSAVSKMEENLRVGNSWIVVKIGDPKYANCPGPRTPVIINSVFRFHSEEG